MSNVDQPDQESMGGAKEIQLRAAEWIMERREAGVWTDQQQTSLDAWLAESPAHLLAYWRLNATWERTHRLAALRPGTPEQSGPGGAAGSLRPVLLRITAACAVLGVLAFGAARFYLRPSETTYATALGGHRTIALADGSRIELNTDTILHVTLARDSRTIELEKGEAVFQVRHDANRSFVVLALEHRVTDLGTKFLVREEEGQLRVALIEGRASFESADPRIQQHSVTMNPGDNVVATAQTMSVTKIAPQALARDLAWRSRMLVFDETPLVAAAAEFNRYNREKLDVADSQIAALKIDGTFRVDNTSGFLDMAQHVLGLHVEKRGEKMAISR